VLLLTQLLVFIRLKFRLDYSGTLTLLLQLIVALTRVISMYQVDDSPYYYSFATFAVNLMWISIYYFTMEMVRIQLAKQPGVSPEKFARVKIIKWVSIAQAILYCIVMTIV